MPHEQQWGIGTKPIELLTMRYAPAYSQEAIAIVVAAMTIAVFYTAWRIIAMVCA